jgi:O-antigen/teichoic acid export membrane protein
MTEQLEKHARSRERRVLMSTASSWLTRAVGFAVPLVTLPVCLAHLGEQQFGFWLTVTSLVSFAGFADLGLGNSLVNSISRSMGANDTEDARHHVNAAFQLLAIEGLIIAVLLSLFSLFVPWNALFGLNSTGSDVESKLSMVVLFVAIGVTLPLSTVQKVQDGYQEGYLNNVFQLVGNLLVMVCILISVRLGKGLPWIVGASLLAPLFAIALNFHLQFKTWRPWLVPSFADRDWKIMMKLGREGGLFFGLNLLTLIGLNTDSLVLSMTLGSSSVVQYGFVQKLSQVAYVLWAFFQALWPAYGEAIARGDKRWVKRTFLVTTLGLFGVGLALGTSLYLLGGEAVRLWSRGQVYPDPMLLLGFAAFIAVNCLVGSLSSLMNAARMLRFQFKCLLMASLTAIALKIHFAYVVGVPGPIWATSVCYLLFFVVPCGAFVLKRLRLWEHELAEFRAE